MDDKGYAPSSPWRGAELAKVHLILLLSLHLHLDALEDTDGSRPSVKRRAVPVTSLTAPGWGTTVGAKELSRPRCTSKRGL